MTIIHHPTYATLAAFAAGNLDPGRSLVVGTHLSLCRQCRQGMHAFEHVGGVLLTSAEPTPMHALAAQRALDRADATPIEVRESVLPTEPLQGGVPRVLAQQTLGPWRWIGRGVHWRSVAGPAEEGVRTFMLKAEPGTRLPRHRHDGTEWTCVLEGAFRHQLGSFGPGDFDEADETVEHHPSIEAGTPCVCLVALQGGIRFQGWIGRMLQPLVRI